MAFPFSKDVIRVREQIRPLKKTCHFKMSAQNFMWLEVQPQLDPSLTEGMGPRVRSEVEGVKEGGSFPM